MIRIIFSACLIIFNIAAFATNYYVSATGSDANNGTSTSTPWLTITKVNTISFLPGDSVLFKKGDTFSGTLTIGVSGTSGNEIIIGGYGTGNKPIITGLVTLTSWTNNGGGIYYATLNATRENIVIIDGSVQKMGRFPNTDYLILEGHTGNTSITDNQLSTPNWTGAEVVIRKNRWIIDRHNITSQSGGTINYSAYNDYGYNTSYNPTDGYGYFIQSDIRTLDQYGEWYFDSTAQRLYVYFGAENPASHVVKAGKFDMNVTVSSKSYLTFNNINFEGGNLVGANITNSNSVKFNSCDFTFQGGMAIYGNTLNGVVVHGGTISNAQSNGIMYEYNVDNCIIDSVTITNTGIIAGAARSGDGIGQAIYSVGGNMTIKYNNVINTGYVGIGFRGGDNSLVQYNFVDSFCLVKDDGAGIYSYEGVGNVTRSNNRVLNNVVLHGIGNNSGTSEGGVAHSYGIYMDDNTNHVLISGNSVAYCSRYNIYFNNANNIILRNNTAYGHPGLFLMTSTAYSLVRNMVLKNNIWYVDKAYSGGDNIAMVWYNAYGTSDIDDMFASPGDIDSNYYCRPLDEIVNPINNLNDGVNYTLSAWKVNSYGFDVHANGSPFAISDTNAQRFEYNSTGLPKTIPLPVVYAGIDGIIYSGGSIQIAPYSSVIILQTAQQPAGNRIRINRKVITQR